MDEEGFFQVIEIPSHGPIANANVDIIHGVLAENAT
jgi:hypothetical protein